MSDIQLLVFGVSFTVILYSGYWVRLKLKIAKLEKALQGKAN